MEIVRRTLFGRRIRSEWNLKRAIANEEPDKLVWQVSKRRGAEFRVSSRDEVGNDRVWLLHYQQIGGDTETE